MINFELHIPTRIIFGRGTHKNVGAQLKSYRKVLLHYGAGSVKRTGVYDDVVISLKENGIDFIELGGVQSNPVLSMVYEGIELCRNAGVDMILAVGGGSVIDSAKTIAMGVPYAGDPWDFFCGKATPESALPVAAVLTIPAAGSESSPNTVITNEAEQLKLGCGYPVLRPIFSIVNPELFLTLPRAQMANGVTDMMSHIFERYFTRTPHTDVVDGLCESTLRAIMRNAKILIDDFENVDAWSEIAWAGTIAHNGLLGVGREQDWACHRMEHELSALYNVAHGAGLAVVTPAWMKHVYRKHLGLFVQFAVNVMGVEGELRDAEATALAGIRKLEDFYRLLGQPVRMSELGIDHAQFDFMAGRAATNPLGNLERLEKADVLAIYRLAADNA